jgi:hypothetical protein
MKGINAFYQFCYFLCFLQQTYIKVTTTKLQRGPRKKTKLQRGLHKKTKLQRGPGSIVRRVGNVHGDVDEEAAGWGARGVKDAYTRAVTTHRATVESRLMKPMLKKHTNDRWILLETSREVDEVANTRIPGGGDEDEPC